MDTTSQHLILTALIACLGIMQTILHNQNTSAISRLRQELVDCRKEIADLQRAFRVRDNPPDTK